VQEGLVYVAMNFHDLQKYIDPPPHARLSGVHSPPYLRRRVQMDSMRSSPERLSFSEALRDAEINAAFGPRDREYARAADSAHDLAAQEESYYGEDFGFGRTDPEAHCDIPSFSSNGPDVIVNPAGEHIPVAVLSDEDAGPEESSSQEVLDFRLQRLRLMRRRYDDSAWDRDDRWIGLNGLRFDANERDRDRERDRESPYNLNRLDALMARSRVYDTPARDTPPPPLPHGATSNPYSEQPLKGAEEEAEKDDNVTCVRFQIKKGKHKVAIKFDPGLSGRFILLKLWANRNNVDVQSIIAKGYGGCRFFPARQVA
jgi:hypothetical protein